MTKINIFDDIKNQPNEKLQALKQLLPNLFDQDGNLIEDELKQFVKQNYEKPNFETFQFNWAGKANAKKIAHEHYVAGTLEPDEERSKNLDTTQNLIIEGDNLQVLHLLKKSYKNKVKCIYIDPPYNTGNDFVYKDEFALNINKYLIETGEIDEETGEQLNPLMEKIENSNGKKHSKWLSMMYPLLHLARELLRDDGVIFISIDDNEVANLKLLMNEVFGESEFVGQITWRRTKNKSNQIKNLANVIDYIFIYAKSKDTLGLNKVESENTGYNYQDQKGLYSRNTILDKKRGKMTYEIVTPNGQKLYGPWIIKEEDFKKFISQNLIHWSDGKNETPYKKVYLEDTGGLSVIDNFWDSKVYGSNQDGSTELEKIFQNNLIFDFPKPVSLIKRILQISTKPNDIILDFFAGSGTTGQAVMELNQEEIDKKASDGMFEASETKGNRKFILVQLPEKISPKKEAYKAGYKKISDITIERVKRAGEKYKSVDNGFKVLKPAENLEEQGLFDGMINKTNEAIFTHLALYYGYGLSYSTEKISNTKEIYILKPQFDQTKNAIVILEKQLLTQDDVMHLINNYGKQEYKFFARDICLNIELTYNLLQHFKEDNIIVF